MIVLENKIFISYTQLQSQSKRTTWKKYGQKHKMKFRPQVPSIFYFFHINLIPGLSSPYYFDSLASWPPSKASPSYRHPSLCGSCRGFEPLNKLNSNRRTRSRSARKSGWRSSSYRIPQIWTWRPSARRRRWRNWERLKTQIQKR